MDIKTFSEDYSPLNIDDMFNLFLVYKKKRPSFLIETIGPKEKPIYCLGTEKDYLRIRTNKINKIKYVKENFPFFKITQFKTFYFIHIKKLPEKLKNENRTQYIGRILGYSYPSYFKTYDKYKYNYTLRYLLIIDSKKITFYNEKVIFKNQIKSKLKSFQEAASELDFKVIEQIERKLNKII